MFGQSKHTPSYLLCFVRFEAFLTTTPQAVTLSMHSPHCNMVVVFPIYNEALIRTQTLHLSSPPPANTQTVRSHHQLLPTKCSTLFHQLMSWVSGSSSFRTPGPISPESQKNCMSVHLRLLLIHSPFGSSTHEKTCLRFHGHGVSHHQTRCQSLYKISSNRLL